MTQVILKTLQSVLVLIFCICLILIFASLGSISFLSFSVIRIAMSCAMFFWLLIRLLRKDLGQVNFIFPWLALFLIWLCVQALGQWFRLEPFFSHVGSWDEQLDLWMVFVTAVVFYLVPQEILTNQQISLFFIQGFIFLSSMLALYLIYVALTAPVPEYFWQIGKLPFVEHLWPWMGSSIYPNYLVKLFFPGAFYALSLVFYVHTLRYDSRHLPTHYSWLLLNLCLACVLIGAIFLTRSRAGIMAFGAALFFYCIFFILSHERRRKALKLFSLILGIIVFFLLLLGLKGVIRELQTISSALSGEIQLKGIRALTIGAGWQLIKAKGLWGVGLGNYQMGWLFNHKPPFDYVPGATFNDFIWIWAETGILGMFFFAGAFLCFMIRGLQKAITTESYFMGYFLLASVFSLAAFSFHALVDPAFYIGPILWLAFSVLGVGEACSHLKSKTEERSAADTGSPPTQKFRSLPNAFLVFVVFFMVIASGWISTQKVRAHLMIQKHRDEGSIQRAIKLDPLNPIYSEMLALHYFQAYEKNKNPELFKEALAAMDKAIRLDSFRYARDVQRAEMFWKAGNERGIKETFDRMRQRLPNFYLAELSASIFYMEHAIQLEEDPRGHYFEDHAVEHYKKAIELYPQFPEAYKLYHFGSEAAHNRYLKLREEGRI